MEICLPWLFLLTVIPGAGWSTEVLQLWNGPAPVTAVSIETPSHPPVLHIHLAEHPDGRVVVVCPGGGYAGKTMGPEGHGIAAWLNLHGIAGAVLDYRLPNGRCEVPLRDAQQAIRLLRARGFARVGILGCSAGGHLAALAASHGSLAPSDQPPCRPDFAILIYPVATLRVGLTHEGTCTHLLGPSPALADREAWSPDNLVDSRTCPCFIAHAVDDRLVPIENSRVLYRALQRAHVESELLELPSGGHGLGGYKGSSWDAWQTAATDWMNRVAPAAR